MTEAHPPRVLFVDDDDLAHPSYLQDVLGAYDVEVRVRPPEEVILPDVAWADVVVVDYFLSNWPERDVDCVARAPQNGLAAIASIRSCLLPALADRGPGSVPPRAVAFALCSGNLSEATFGLPDEVLPYVFSRENNLEWVFECGELAGSAAMQIGMLAHAVRSLPSTWPDDREDAETQLFSLLGLADPYSGESTEGYWQSDARQEVLDCRPPLHELSARSHGLALVRWMLHRILPYPCFLMDELQLRARLRVDALEGGEAVGASLNEVLEPYQYSGVTAGFDGQRWWRAGVEDWLFQVTEGESGSPRAVAEAALSHGAISTQGWVRPVVVVGGDLVRSLDLAEVEETVRVRPDDWPAFADVAYARRAEVRDDTYLRALVVPADRALVDGGSVEDAVQ